MSIPTLTSEEEANLILDDIFDQDYDGQMSVIAGLCDDFGIAHCPENEDEVLDLIIENEDLIYRMYQDYLVEIDA
jgi:hypothetical protein